MKLILPIIFLLCFASCNNSQFKYRQTAQVCDKTYVEVFSIYGNGAFGGDMLTEYLTDSVKYRIHVGNFDESDQYYRYHCDKSKIYVEKVEKDESGKLQVIDSKVFDRDSLRAVGGYR